MSSEDEMVTWLRRQLDEQEADARSAQEVATDGDLMALLDFTLAEVATKRKIVDIHNRIDCQHDRNFSADGDCAECGNEYPCETVRLIAEPYAVGGSGYSEEWRP